MSDKHRETCLTSLVIRESQTETTAGDHFTPTSVTMITNMDKTKSCVSDHKLLIAKFRLKWKSLNIHTCMFFINMSE